MTSDRREEGEFRDGREDDSHSLPFSFSRLLQQSEYGPLSYILSFLPVVEMLHLRVVSRFFQELVRVAVGLRDVRDNELVDLNLRFAKFAHRRHSLMPLHRPIASDEFVDLPPTLVNAFGFLASTSKFSLMHVAVFVEQEAGKWGGISLNLNLLITESVLSEEKDRRDGEERRTSPPRFSRFSSFVWAIRLCLCDIELAFATSESEEANLVVFCGDCQLEPGTDEVSIRPSFSFAKKQDEEEGGNENDFLSLRRGVVTFRRFATHSTGGGEGKESEQETKGVRLPRSREWTPKKIDAFFERCSSQNVVPLFESWSWSDWCDCRGRIQPTTPEIFLRLVDSWPLVLHFLHEHLVSAQSLLFAWHVPFRQKRFLLEVIPVLLEERRAVSFVDPGESLLRSIVRGLGGYGDGRRSMSSSCFNKNSLMSVIVKRLLDRGCTLVIEPEEQESLLRRLLRSSEKRFVSPRDVGLEFLTDILGVSIDQPSIFRNNCLSPLISAAKGHCWSAFRFILERIGPESVSLVDEDGRSALHFAAKSNQHTDKVENLLKICPDLANVRDKNGETPLEFALHNFFFQSAKVLLDFTTDKIRWDLTKEGTMSVYTRVFLGREVFERIEREHELVFPLGLRKEAFLEACRSGSSAFVLNLIARPFFVDVTEETLDEDGVIPLIQRQEIYVRACSEFHSDVACFILPTIPIDGGISGVCDVSVSTFPIEFAAESRQERILEGLVAAARSSPRWIRDLQPHLQQFAPKTILTYLKGVSSSEEDEPRKVLPILGVLKPFLVGVMDEESIEAFFSLLMTDEKPPMRRELFVVATAFCPQLWPRISDLVSDHEKTALFCSCLATKGGSCDFARGLISSGQLSPTELIPKEIVGIRGGSLLCNSYTPVCLALHADLPELLETTLCFLQSEDQSEKDAVIFEAARSILSLSSFAVRRLLSQRSFGVLLDHCPSLLRMLRGEEGIELPWSGDGLDWICQRADSETILRD